MNNISLAQLFRLLLSIFFAGLILFIFVNQLNDGKPISPSAYLVLFFAILLFAGAAFDYYRLHKGGQIEIKLDKQEFTLGEPMAGTIFLKLQKNVEARSLSVAFYGLSGGKHRRKVCLIETQLSAGKTYRYGENVPFSIKMPSEVDKYLAKGDGGFIDSFRGAFPMPWYVEAKLDLPKAVDMVKIAELRIRRPGGVTQ